VQYLSCSVDDSETVADALAGHSAVQDRSVIDSGDPAVFQVTIDEETPESLLGAVGAPRSVDDGHPRSGDDRLRTRQSGAPPVGSRPPERGVRTHRRPVGRRDTQRPHWRALGPRRPRFADRQTAGRPRSGLPSGLLRAPPPAVGGRDRRVARHHPHDLPPASPGRRTETVRPAVRRPQRVGDGPRPVRLSRRRRSVKISRR